MAKTKRTKVRIYQRAGSDCFYGDFRSIGGGRESLGTTDEKEARQKYDDRAQEVVQEQERKRVDAAVEAEKARDMEVLKKYLRIDRTAALGAFAAHHLRQKARAGKYTEGWLQNSEQRLGVAVAHFGADRELHSIDAADVEAFAFWLAEQPVRRGNPSKRGAVAPTRTLSRQTARHYLNALSNLYQRAQAERVVPAGHNPVALMLEKPTPVRHEARWLEAHDAALLLESARTFKPKRDDIAMPFAYPMVATFMLSGGRAKEVLGLEVEDLSFDRRTITFRPNEHRRLKTLTSLRVVPMHPQLEAILREYVFGGQGPLSGLLFPSSRTGAAKMLTDVRKMLDAVAERAGWKAGEVRTKMFRHTYCAARLQTTDRGEPIAVYTVARELGHGGDSLVKRVYGHLGTIRHRAEHVEFRVENHVETVEGYAERARVLAQS